MTRTLLLIAACVVTNGAGQLLLRLGAMGAAPATFELATWVGLFSRWPIVAGLILWGVSMVAWLAVLGRAELSYAYLFGSVNYVAVPLAAAMLLGETLPRARLLGMVCILAGVILVLQGGNRALVR